MHNSCGKVVDMRITKSFWMKPAVPGLQGSFLVDLGNVENCESNRPRHEASILAFSFTFGVRLQFAARQPAGFVLVLFGVLCP